MKKNVQIIIYSQALSVRFTSSEPLTSNEPFETHQRFISRNGVGEHTNIMNIKRPSSAINISKNANGDIESASFTSIVAFK